MKHTLLFYSLFVSYSICIAQSSQQVLFLKSGERLIGKTERIKGDSIIFSYKGAKIQLNLKEISVLYFDEKTSPATLNTNNQISELASKNSKEGKITGVVTYFFNNNYGDKPDIGAEIYIVDSSQLKDFNINTLDSFKYANAYRNMASRYKLMKKPVPDDIKEKIQFYGVENDDAFKSLDSRAATNVFKLKYSSAIKTVVDGNGNFSVMVLPGTYFICIRSNNRQGLSVTEISGKFVCEKITVKNGETVNVSHNFSLN